MTRRPRRRSPLLIVAALVFATGVPTQSVSITDVGQRLRVEFDGRFVTDYHYQGYPKPILYPVHGPSGAALTRNWPMRAGADEKEDHPHQRSLWFAHGAVNGHDFWAEGPGSGRIVHERIIEVACAGRTGTIGAHNRWVAADGTTVCTEDRTLRFHDLPGAMLLDYEVTLHASHGELLLGDTKEGTMAIRLHPALRLKGPVAQGHCVNAGGQRDGEVWGKRAAWVDYSGPVEDEVVGVAIFDHPHNHAHPTWWHARDYGLFAANPFGAHDFEKKPKGSGDLTVKAGDSLTLRYRFYFHRGDAEGAAVAARYRDYARAPAGMQLVCAEEFDSAAALSQFTFTDAKAWRAADGALDLFAASNYDPPVRSPRNVALLAGAEVEDFVLDARLQQTGREYGHRDLCLVFGYRDPSHFYYVHMASKADDHAHNVFIVNGAPRTKIATKTTDGVAWGTGEWHAVRLERSAETGRIAVYFDDLETPIMEAEDRTFGRGSVGFGSFDDTGRIDSVRLWARSLRHRR